MGLIKKIKNANIEEEPKTLWNIPFIVVLVFGFISGSANQMVNPLISKYAVELGANLSLAGTIVGLQAGMAMCFRPLSGAASDMLNRKYVMIGSIIISSLAFSGYLLFKSIAAVIVCRLLQGLAFAFMSVARTAFATEYMPKDRMGEGIAYTSFGIVLSQMLGPNIGLWVSENFGYQYCFATALVLSLLGIALLSQVPYKHKKNEQKREKIKLSNLIAFSIIPYALLSGLFSMTTQLANSFIALLGEERGIANVGLFFTVYSIVALVLRPISGKILDRYGLSVIIFPAYVFASLTMVFLGIAQSLTLILFAAACKALSQGVAMPSIQGAAVKRLGKEKAGVASATIHMGQDMLNLIAPAIAGSIVTVTDYRTMYLIFAAVVIMGIPLYMLLNRFEKRRAA